MDQFLQKSKIAHGNCYDYSRVRYVNSITPVTIICQFHGEFTQLPKVHIKGHGCPKCGGNQADPLRFLQKARERHGETYDYTLTEFQHSLTLVTIVCRIHGAFNQTPANHLRGSGCPECARLRNKRLHLIDHEEFLRRAKEMHGSRYAYGSYAGMRVRMEIICSVHGSFNQKPHSHLAGNGCPFCAGVIRTTSRFIEKAKLVYRNRYTYEHVHYVNSKAKVSITCPIHQQFEIVAAEFLRGSSCPGCMVSHPEKVWLDANDVQDRQIKITLEKSYVKVDGFDPKTNTVYEFYGDFWHGNPAIYSPHDINPVRKLSFGQLYIDTIQREAALKAAGYKVVSIWENDWRGQISIS